MSMPRIAVFLFIVITFSRGSGLNGVLITILSQSTEWHQSLATHKQSQWSASGATVLLSTRLATDGQPWTIVPLLSLLAREHLNAQWFLIVTEWTQVNTDTLNRTLSAYDPNKEWFIGHALEDTESVITHHYNHPHSLKFPLLHSGIILSAPAVRRLATLSEKFSQSFNIDSGFEFAQFLHYQHTPTFEELFPNPAPPPPSSLQLTHESTFCSTKATQSCATGFTLSPDCGGKVSLDRVFFAVKTCSQFHSTRLPVVWDTWAVGLSDRSIGYYSDKEDKKFNTISLGVPNTPRGHCGKLEAILRLFERVHKDRDWLIVVDDDTLLSVERLLRMLRCYDHTQPLLLGEVYGYEAHLDGGTSYVTGGGGMVLSSAAVRSFVSSQRTCPTIDFADDMFLGMIAQTLDWQIVHSPLFHQDQPKSYSDALLEGAVSFHRHSPQDPHLFYQRYLTDSTLARDRSEL